MAVVEGEAAQEAGAKGDGLESAGGGIDDAEMAGAGVEQPQPSVVPARGVRHRQLVGDDGVRAHVDQRAALGAPRAPTVDDV